MKKKAITLKCSSCDGQVLLLYGVTNEGMAFVCDNCNAMIHLTHEELMTLSLSVDKPKKVKSNGKG